MMNVNGLYEIPGKKMISIVDARENDRDNQTLVFVGEGGGR